MREVEGRKRRMQGGKNGVQMAGLRVLFLGCFGFSTTFTGLGRKERAQSGLIQRHMESFHLHQHLCFSLGRIIRRGNLRQDTGVSVRDRTTFRAPKVLPMISCTY
jgi:hypothetical protein